MIGPCRRWALAAFALCIGAMTAAAAREATQEESDEAFRIFNNVKRQVVEQCITKPAERAVLAGVIDALQRELVPEAAPYFPPKLDPDYRKAFHQFQESLRDLVRQPEAGGRSLKELVELGLRSYCRRLYRYADYDDRATYEREVALRKSVYSGVGMTLDRTLEGVDCYPFIGEPASLAGVIAGDRLLAVDGKPVRGLNVVDIGAMIAGAEGTPVELRVRRRLDGKEETVKAIRGRIMKSPLSVEVRGEVPVVRLGRLSMETVQELKIFLKTIKPGTPLTLDLRGCPGGELNAAVAIAELFLPAGAPIGRLETRTTPEEFRSTNRAPFRPKPFVILQDRGTASGAELIIMALLSHAPLAVETRGERSFGKGYTLVDVLVEDGGGRLRIPDGRLYGPEQRVWDGEGIAPATEDPRAP